MTDETPPDTQVVRPKSISSSSARSISSTTLFASKSLLSLNHVQAAALFSRYALRAEQELAGLSVRPTDSAYVDHKSFVIGAVFSSVAFLEATINEFLSRAADSPDEFRKSIDDDSIVFLASLWNTDEIRKNMNLLAKYQISLTGTRHDAFDKGRRPFQDVALISTVRNELVHYKPAYLPSSKGGRHWAEKLRNKFDPNPLFPGNTESPFFPDQMLGHGCAEWSVNGCIAFADEFFNRIGTDRPYDKIRDRLNTR